MDFILIGSKCGFRVGYDSGNGDKLPEKKEYAIGGGQSTGSPSRDEKSGGLGPFIRARVPGVHLSRFGVIPKSSQPSKWRLIVMS